MTFDQALELAVDGHKVRAVDMQPGSWVEYNFKGYERHFESGDHSAYRFNEHDQQIEWQEYVPPVVNVGWGAFAPPLVPVEPPKHIMCKPKRRAWSPPAEVNDIDDQPKQQGWAVFHGQA